MIPKNYKAENHPLIEYWQDVKQNPNLIHHRSITPQMIKIESKRLCEYELDELRVAIANYNYVMGHMTDTFYGQYPHKFIEFFRDGVNKNAPYIKFITEKKYNPRSELLKNKYHFEAGNPGKPSNEVAL